MDDARLSFGFYIRRKIRPTECLGKNFANAYSDALLHGKRFETVALGKCFRWFENTGKKCQKIAKLSVCQTRNSGFDS